MRDNTASVLMVVVVVLGIFGVSVVLQEGCVISNKGALDVQRAHIERCSIMVKACTATLTPDLMVSCDTAFQQCAKP